MRKPVIGGGVVAAIAVIVLALVLAGGSDDKGGSSVAEPSPLATESPAPTTESQAQTLTPTGPEAEARNLALIEVKGVLAFATDAADVPENRQGAFYLDIETGALEGWYAVSDEINFHAFSASGRFTVFEPRDVAADEWMFPNGRYLADRRSRKVYRWEGNARPVLQQQENGNNEVAASGGLVLFRVRVEDGDDWFSLLNVDTGETEAAFQAAGEWALISGDGSRIALAGADEFPDVFIVDVATGEVERVAEVMLDAVDVEGMIGLLEGGDGETFAFVADPAKARYSGIVTRFTWAGNRVSEIAGAKVFVSPRAEFVAATEPLVGDTQEPTPWYVINAFDLRDGNAMFRVVGALQGLGFWRGNRWLADGSGLVVQRPARMLTLAMRDGDFREFVGMPSPDSLLVFGIYGGAVDMAGELLVTASFADRVRDYMDPWGASGDEVRILVPRGGHGGPGFVASIVEPYVEEAPFVGEPELQLSDAGVAKGLVNLSAEPGGAVVGQVGPPYRLRVKEVTRRCSGDFEIYDDVEDCPPLDSTANEDFVASITGEAVTEGRLLAGTWARVTTAAGREGWMLLEVHAIGI